MISNFSLSFLHRLQMRTTKTKIYNSITFMEKIVPSVALQLDFESRRLWRLLTRALAGYMTEMEADTAKRSVEDWARNMGDDKRKLQFFDVEGDDLENAQFKFRSSRGNGS
jgi:hypothetical protein